VYGWRLDRLLLTTKKSTEKPLPSSKTLHGFNHKILWSRPSKLPEKLSKNKNFTEKA
jgi:hypothetical protein